MEFFHKDTPSPFQRKASRRVAGKTSQPRRLEPTLGRKEPGFPVQLWGGPSVSLVLDESLGLPGLCPWMVTKCPEQENRTSLRLS